MSSNDPPSIGDSTKRPGRPRRRVTTAVSSPVSVPGSVPPVRRECRCSSVVPRFVWHHVRRARSRRLPLDENHGQHQPAVSTTAPVSPSPVRSTLFETAPPRPPPEARRGHRRRGASSALGPGHMEFGELGVEGGGSSSSGSRRTASSSARRRAPAGSGLTAGRLRTQLGGPAARRPPAASTRRVLVGAGTKTWSSVQSELSLPERGPATGSGPGSGTPAPSTTSSR